jgi:hypothetical protein
MQVSMTVTIKAGKRTPVQVWATPNGPNDRIITLPTGESVNESVVAQYVANNLKSALQEFSLT